MTLSSLLPVAALLRIPASALVALPVAVEVFARKAGMTADAMVSELLVNEPLRDYLSEVCLTAHASAGEV